MPKAQMVIHRPVSLKTFAAIALTVLLLARSGEGSGQSIDSQDLRTLDIDVFFPRAFGIAVNQVGYMNGSSLDHIGGPWRAGIRRSFDVRDYEPIVEVGRAVGIRLMSLFALAEMDRLNVVATLPHATPAGTSFDNSPNVSPRQLEIMSYVGNEAAYLELGVTGVGHEWWVDGERSRSEWYDLDNKQPRPETMMRKHLDVIRNILGQYGLNDEYGHSFPESFSALGYYWNPEGDYSTGKLFSEYGAKYVNTKFSIIPELNPPEPHSAGFDQGVLVMDRAGYGNLWHAYADLPSQPVEAFETDIIESHWANWLATDDFLQPALNEQWVEFFREIQHYPYRYLAKNTEQLYSQWLYKQYTEITLDGDGRATINNLAMPDASYHQDLLGNLVLAVPLRDGEHISSAHIDDRLVPAYFEDSGYGFLYLPRLEKKTYLLTWEIGEEPIPYTVNNSGTYNVYEMREEGQTRHYHLQMYGSQDVRFRIPEGYAIQSNDASLSIDGANYDHEAGEMVVTVTGHNIQGERGIVTISPNP